MKRLEEDRNIGLYPKYYIQKFTGEYENTFFGDKVPIFEPVDPKAEYFVLRLDYGGGDPIHIAACRKAILVYAKEIKNHLPVLSKELKEKYGV